MRFDTSRTPNRHGPRPGRLSRSLLFAELGGKRGTMTRFVSTTTSPASKRSSRIDSNVKKRMWVRSSKPVSRYWNATSQKGKAEIAVRHVRH